LAGRVNAALVATYTNPDCVKRVTGLTGNHFIGLAFDHQRFEIWWLTENSLTDLNRVLKIAIGADHVRIRDRRRKFDDGSQEVAKTISDPVVIGSDVEAEDSHSPIDTVIDAEFEEIEEDSETESDPPSSLTSQPLQQPPEVDESQAEQCRSSVPDVLDVTVNPITKVWSFEIDGVQIEIETRHSYVRVDGDLLYIPALPSLSDIGDLSGDALELILEVIRLRTSHSAIEDRLGRKGQGPVQK